MSKNNNIYTRVLLSKKITVPFNEINNDLQNLLLNIIKKNEGLCIDEGYIKPGSIKLVSYSSGKLFAHFVEFNIIYECLITVPTESMELDCIVNSVTKVGIRAELNEQPSPFVIFIARDHHFNNELFHDIKENDIIKVRVIGQRFELNDKFISVIAELLKFDNYETTKSELKN